MLQVRVVDPKKMPEQRRTSFAMAVVGSVEAVDPLRRDWRQATDGPLLFLQSSVDATVAMGFPPHTDAPGPSRGIWTMGEDAPGTLDRRLRVPIEYFAGRGRATLKRIAATVDLIAVVVTPAELALAKRDDHTFAASVLANLTVLRSGLHRLHVAVLVRTDELECTCESTPESSHFGPACELAGWFGPLRQHGGEAAEPSVTSSVVVCSSRMLSTEQALRHWTMCRRAAGPRRKGEGCEIDMGGQVG